MERKRTLKQDLSMIWRGIQINFRIMPQYLTWRIISTLFDLISPYFALYMSSLVVSALAERCDLSHLFYLAAITVLGLFVLSMTGRLMKGRVNIHESSSWWNDSLFNMHVQNRMQYDHMENPDVILLRERIFAARDANGGGLVRIAFEIDKVFRGLFHVICSTALTVSMFQTVTNRDLDGFLAFVNSSLSAWCIFGLLLSNIILCIFTTNSETQKVQEAWKTIAHWNTRDHVLSQLEGLDLPIFGINRILIREHAKTLDAPYVKLAEKYKIKYGAIRMIWDHFMTFILFVFVAAKAYLGVFGIGSFILYRGTIQKFMDGITELASVIGILLQNNDPLEEQFLFLDLPDDMYHGTLSVEKRDDIDYEIEFRDVSFKYPRSNVWALRHVSLKFKIGDRMAVVGMNGSGKTTFIKLLCRLYDPTEGKILLNGIDITRYRYDEYMRIFSVVFQDYKLFSFSIAHNVSAEMDYDADKICSCLERAGFGNRLRELERGIETPLHRDYEDDGIDVSGGEAQKIAIARALYKEAPFIILDEPTAALDPLAEAEIYSQFNEIVENKTAIYISHRLSSCRFCSNIVVFDHGQIVQQGSHDDLVTDEKGKYHELWHAQAKYYV